MTFAPPALLAARAYLKGQDADLDSSELGINGGPSHVATGTSYHLGLDQLKMSKNPYSARTPRDRAGLSNAASALDIDDDLDELRELSVWLVEQCRANAPDTRDIREVIFSPDGARVLQWDRERGVSSLPQPHSDLSHREHTHVSWYRDSESRDKTAVFKRFFEGESMPQAEEQHAVFQAVFEGGQSCGHYRNPGNGNPPSNSIIQKLDHIGERVEELRGPAPVELDYTKLTEVVRMVVRQELDATRFGRSQA